MNRPITKSLFLKRRQCHKRLWLATQGVKEPEIEPADVWEEREEEGAEVEAYAERLFSGAVRLGQDAGAITPDNDVLARGNPLFQAGLQADGLLVDCDIVEPRDRSLFLWEVKASSYDGQATKPIYDSDLGFQVHLAGKAGYQVVGAGLLLLRKQFVRGDGDIDPRALIVGVDRTAEVRALLPRLERELEAMQSSLAMATAPDEHPAARCKGDTKATAGNRLSACGHLTKAGERGRHLPHFWAGRLPILKGAKADYVYGQAGLAIQA